MKWQTSKRMKVFIGLSLLWWSTCVEGFHVAMLLQPGRRNEPLFRRISQCMRRQGWSESEDTTYRAPEIERLRIREERRLAARDARETYPLSRRRMLQGITAASFLIPILPAVAGKPEIDSKTGNLFTPKGDMLAGGSVAARGIPVSKSSGRPPAGEALQSIYETRFVAYLSRFLLNFDPSARAYWVQQGFGDTWEEYRIADSTEFDKSENAFAEFAESVEVGLADYFSGPFGSYSSLPAAVAGINAAQPAPSRKSEMPKKHSFLNDIFSKERLKKDDDRKRDSITAQKQGILNLYTLLKARYNSLSAKRQLAILFSFVSSPSLQPVNEIRSLLGEADNSTITRVRIVNSQSVASEAESRTSSRRGGGYSFAEMPTITIESPPPLGDKYREAKVAPIMETTSRVLRITLTDGGEGYTSAPIVNVVQVNGIALRQCQATAVLDRAGHVEFIVVLDPGYGYGGRKEALPPRIIIDPPSRARGQVQQGRRAKAYADLEYKIAGINILDGGSGFVSTEPPKVKITPPKEDPDWFLYVQEQPSMRMIPVLDPEPLRGEVTEMRFADGNVAYSVDGVPDRATVIRDDLLERLVRDPLELLPSSVRPQLVWNPASGTFVYIILQLAAVPQFVAAMSPRYRACDPVFGGVGRLPVTKGANALTVSEYARLALSGAVCTVVVRTLLNPLELIKTKQQLQNDDELFDFARSNVQSEELEAGPLSSKQGDSDNFSAPANVSEAALSTTTMLMSPPTSSIVIAGAAATKKVAVSTVDMISSIVELRGPLALFQSADITFLASLVFGSFGFGATELFRRSFTGFFFTESGGDSGAEIVLLLAASLATVLTAAAASPFEVLRVRSMGLVEPKKWTNVLEEFLKEKSPDAQLKTRTEAAGADFDLRSLRFRDLVPLSSGFAPILSRELPFAIAKFLTYDLIAKTTLSFLNSQASEGALPIQVGVGPIGLTVSAAAGAVAGIAGAFVSHPADLILTKMSASKRKAAITESQSISDEGNVAGPEWVIVVKDLISQDGGIFNLFVGLGSRSIFFFLVIGLQFFLYDYVKNLFQVSSDDLSLVLDVFYAVRAGLVGMDSSQ